MAADRPEPSPDEPELLREIEVRDPDPQGAAPEGYDAEADADGEGAPYQGLLVPLVVVPALIVMVAVLIAVLFGLLSGSASSPRENLDRLLHGGANERTQAAFELVRQILDYQTAKGEGREPEWGIDESFLEDLRRERASLEDPEGPDQLWAPFVLSSLMAQLGDPDGVRQLLDLTRLGESLDPDFQFGQNAMFVLGSIGDELDEPLRLATAERLISLLEDEDEGVVLLATAALQSLASPGTIPALEGLLGSRRLDLRIQAALSLVELGDDGGREVLVAASVPAPYEAERAEHPRRWAPQTVSETRRKVLLALAAIDAPDLDAVLRPLADGDDDPNVRSLAIELLDRAEG